MKARSTAKDNSGLRQVLTATEPALYVGACGGGVTLDHLLGRRDRHPHEITIALDVGEAQQGFAALALAEILAGPSLLEILLRDHESIGVLVDDLEAIARGFGERFAVEQDADTFARAATDPS